MEKIDKEKFWNECLEYIRDNVSEQAYSTWFEGIGITDLSLEEITINVPNKFHYEWLEEKYRHLIDAAIKKTGSHPLVVNYSIVISNKSPDEIPAIPKTPTSIIIDTNIIALSISMNNLIYTHL